MNRKALYFAASSLLAAMPLTANASTVNLNFGGPGVSASLTLTFGAATDAKNTQGFEVTGITGTFTDTNLGITNAAVTGLVPINRATPQPGNIQAPIDFSRFFVTAGTSHGSLSYDNLYFPGGSPQSAPLADYPFHGGLLDIYGLLFTINGGDDVNLWSNGLLPGATADDYGVTVAISALQLDSVSSGVALTPEPSSLLLLGTGFLALLAWRRRSIFGMDL